MHPLSVHDPAFCYAYLKCIPFEHGTSTYAERPVQKRERRM